MYDDYGEDGLRGGMPSGTGEHPGNFTSYTFHGDPHETFRMFFGDENPFQGFFSFGGGPGGGGGSRPHQFGGFGHDVDMDMDMDEPFSRQFGRQGFSSGGQPFHRRKEQDKPIVRDLPVSLEDICTGCTKKMKITRNISQPNGQTIKEEKILTIDIKPGWKAGTKITFPKEGDQTPYNIPADVVFVIRDKRHTQFTRDGNDIRFTAKISLTDALCGTTIYVPTIGGRTIPLRLSEVIKPNTVRHIKGEGVPLAKQTSKRGDLIIEFEIVFPDELSRRAKQILSENLPS